jgi:hypothetical protein
MGSATDSLSGTVTTQGANDSDFMHIASDFLLEQGVLSKAENDFSVGENSPANKSVDVQPGIAYVKNTAWARSDFLTKYYRVESDAIENVVISDNASGNPRIDLIVLKIDSSVTPDANASNVATVTVIEGTPAASPTAPAIPSDGNHYLELAEVAVANGFSSIVDANITDRRKNLAALTGPSWDGWTLLSPTVTYSSVDDPTGVVTISGNLTSYFSNGMRIKFDNGGNTIYGIITKVSYSAPNTVITFLHEINFSTGQALTLMANSAITNFNYSPMKAPQGFPLDPTKWTILWSPTGYVTTVTSNVTYTIGSQSIPIGSWYLKPKLSITTYANPSTYILLRASFSTTPEAIDGSSVELMRYYGASADLRIALNMGATHIINLSSKVTYYLNAVTTAAGTIGYLGIDSTNHGARILVECAYL